MDRRVKVGHVSRPHGIQGEVVVHRYGTSKEVLAVGATLFCERSGREFPLTVRGARPHKKQWLVFFEGIEDRNEAEMLAGATLFVGEQTLPPLPEGTYYNFQLLGLAVVTVDGEDLGKVDDIVETGGRDILVVQGPRGEVLLPSIPQVIHEVKLEEGTILVELLPGLIEEDDS